MAPRKHNNNKRAKRSNNRKGGQNGITARQSTRTRSNGLSNQGAIRRPMNNKVFVESGSDFLGPLTVAAAPATAAARILLAQSISPSAFAGTRLTQLSQLWERYRFRKFRLRWVPAVPKTLACQLIIYQDTDPLDDPSVITDADALVRQATAQTGSQQFNFINKMGIDLARRSDDQLYYTGVDKQNERFNRQGNFYVIQVTDPVNFNGDTLTDNIMAGSIYVDWVCEFQIPQINPTAVTQALELPPVSTSITLEPTETELLPGTDTIGTITVSGSTYITPGQINFKTKESPEINATLNIKIDGRMIGYTNLSSLPSASGVSTPVLFEPGTYNVSLTADALTLISPLLIRCISDSNVAPVFTHV